METIGGVCHISMHYFWKICEKNEIDAPHELKKEKTLKNIKDHSAMFFPHAKFQENQTDF